jgi:hypothetical protein
MKVCVSFLARAIPVFALLCAVAGCPGALDPGSVGGAGSSGGGGTGMVACGGSSGTSTLATWANVKDVVNNTCFGADCHVQGEQAPTLLGLNAAPLSDTALYSALTTFTSTMCGQRLLVKPCAPDESAFYLAQAGMCGAALPYMPFGCSPAYMNCTPDDKLEGIREWIANGAPSQ